LLIAFIFVLGWESVQQFPDLIAALKDRAYKKGKEKRTKESG